MPRIPGWHQYQIISIIKYQSRDICCTRWLACVPWLHMCREFFIIITYGCMSSLRILTSILKSPHLVTHFFCLAHSAVRILVSTSYKAPGSLSAKKKKTERKKEKTASKQEENKWVCYISWALKHFRSSGRLPHCSALLNSTVGRRRGPAGGSGFYCGMGVWMGVSCRESGYSVWVLDVLETAATSCEIYIPP